GERAMNRILIGVAVVVPFAVALVAQNAKTGDGDWPLYSRDLAGTKYSPLAQITTANVSTLTEAWSVRLVPPAGRRGAAPPAGAPAAVAPEESAAQRPSTPLRAGGDGASAAAGRGAAGSQAAEGRGGRGAVDAFGNPPGNPEATPIVVNGVMYLPIGGTRIVALDGESGKELWQHELPKGSVTTARGLAYWAVDGSQQARLLFSVGAEL